MSKPTGKLAFAYQSIAILERENEELKAKVTELEREKGNYKGSFEVLSERLERIQKEQAIHDLEQQARGATDICNKALDKLTIPEMSALRAEYFKAGITALAYAIDREAKQLGGAE